MDYSAFQKEKIDYLISAFSRAKGEYERYVCQSLYQKINISELKPVVRGYSRAENDKFYETSLYFPQVNIALNIVDSVEELVYPSDNTELELEIYECLTPDNKPKYQEYELETNLNFSELEEKLDTLAILIRKAWNNLESDRKIWEHSEIWDYERALVETCKDDEIKTTDKILFPSVKDACNILFNSGFEEEFKGLDYLNINGEKEYSFTIWVPEISVPEEDSGNYVTVFEDEEIKESLPIYDAKPKSEKDKLPRVTFVKTTDPLTKNTGYRFAGVYKWYSEYDAVVNRTSIYKRIKTNFPTLEISQK